MYEGSVSRLYVWRIYNFKVKLLCDKLSIQDLPESLSKLKKLERLDLGDNEIDFLPPHIGALGALEGSICTRPPHTGL